jgi:hypothetical protein
MQDSSHQSLGGELRRFWTTRFAGHAAPSPQKVRRNCPPTPSHPNRTNDHRRSSKPVFKPGRTSSFHAKPFMFYGAVELGAATAAAAPCDGGIRGHAAEDLAVRPVRALTYLWLIILAYTTTVAHDVNRQRLHHILVHRSTNLRHLDTNPIKVLIESLLWIDGRYWLPYLVVFTIFLAPAERRLGSLRWVLVDARTGRVVAGDRRSGYGLTLQQVAERLGYSDS